MNEHFRIIVQKYGGSSVATPEKIQAVAQFIKSNLKEHMRFCVVVSAMGHTTNGLLSLAQQVARDPSKRELDMLISCGERSSMALLAMALQDVGVSALSLTGSQSGIITDECHSGAEIKAIRPRRVLEAFAEHQVVIIAGFQGMSLKKEITTLRRGGSDTTAVAMAAALKAEVCEIYTDVAGIMDVDPKIVPHAQVIEKISVEKMEAMALYGARVLAHDAIRLAKDFGVSVRVAEVYEPNIGTKVEQVDLSAAGKPVVALSHLRAIIRLLLDKEALHNLANKDGYFLCGYAQGDEIFAYVSNDIAQELMSMDEAGVRQGLALITVHLQKNQFALPVMARIKQALAQKDIALVDMIIGRNEIFLILADEHLFSALTMLHEGLLSQEVCL